MTRFRAIGRVPRATRSVVRDDLLANCYSGRLRPWEAEARAIELRIAGSGRVGIGRHTQELSERQASSRPQSSRSGNTMTSTGSLQPTMAASSRSENCPDSVHLRHPTAWTSACRASTYPPWPCASLRSPACHTHSRSPLVTWSGGRRGARHRTDVERVSHLGF
jgi:hypothetical protein